MKYNWTARDLDEFTQQFPAAAAFLNHRSLINEYRHLDHNENVLSLFERARMRSIERICGFTHDTAVEADALDALYE